MNDEIWTCRDGTKIPVGDMHEDHVRNALRMILRAQRTLAVRALVSKVRSFSSPWERGTPMVEWPEDDHGPHRDGVSETADSQDGYHPPSPDCENT